MDELTKMMELIMAETNLMHQIEKHLNGIRDLNLEEGKLVNKKISNFDINESKHLEESVANFSERQAKEYFTIAQLYLKRAAIHKERLEYLE